MPPVKPLKFFLFKALLWLCLVVLLSGCGSSTNKILPSATRQSPTITLVQQVSPTPSPQASLPPTVTSTLKPSATPTHLPATPTSSLTATPALLPPLPTIQSSDDYTLVTPAASDLIRLSELDIYLFEYVNKNRVVFEENRWLDIRHKDAERGKEMLGLELSLFYPDGLPNPETVYQHQKMSPNYLPEVYFDLLTNAVFDEVVHNSDAIQGGKKIDNRWYQAEVHQVELDHDPHPEWLLKIYWKQMYSTTWLVLDSKPDGGYHRLQADLPTIVNDIWDDNSLEVLHDFTGDGLTDLIYLDQNYLMGTNMGTFYVAMGGPKGFKEIDQVEQVIGGYLSEGLLYTIKTSPEVPLTTLTLENPNSISWGCSWDTVETYRWPNGKQLKTVNGEKAPQTPACQLAQAVRAVQRPDHKTAISLLESAARSLPQDSPAALFARYRLAVLYAHTGSDDLARRHFQWFASHYQEAEGFKKTKIEPLISQQPLNSFDLCKLFLPATEETYSAMPEEWQRYVSVTYAINAYPASGEPYPPALCPIEDMLSETLESIEYKSSESPEATLKAAGLPVEAVNEYRLEPTNEPAWLALLDLDLPYVIGYLPDAEGVKKWKILQSFLNAKTFPLVFSNDVTGDDIPELAYYALETNTWGCKAGDHQYAVLLITSVGPYVSMVTNNVCTNSKKPFDIQSILVDQDGDKLVDWAVEKVDQNKSPDFLTAKRYGPLAWFAPNEIESALKPQPESAKNQSEEAYQSPNPAQARDELLTARNALAADQIDSEHNWQRLTYLIAITYQREGRSGEALETFLSILQRETQTFWGHMALIHLQEKR